MEVENKMKPESLSIDEGNFSEEDIRVEAKVFSPKLVNMFP